MTALKIALDGTPLMECNAGKCIKGRLATGDCNRHEWCPWVSFCVLMVKVTFVATVSPPLSLRFNIPTCLIESLTGRVTVCLCVRACVLYCGSFSLSNLYRIESCGEYWAMNWKESGSKTSSPNQGTEPLKGSRYSYWPRVGHRTDRSSRPGRDKTSPWRMPSSGMLLSVALLRADVSEESMS
jgi:hypothetical protein